MESSDFTAVFAQVSNGNAKPIEPIDLAQSFLTLSSKQQFLLTDPEVLRAIGLSVRAIFN